MDCVDNSNHMCLICKQQVVGLLNYVQHFKSHVTPQESYIAEQKFSENDLKGFPAASNRNDHSDNYNKNEGSNLNQHSNKNVQESGTYSGDTSPMSEFIDNADDFNDPDLGTDAILSPKHCPDFFQSLELKSATEEVHPRPKIKAVQRLSILEDDIHAESLLPITSILSNLEFSSDEDFIGVSDNEGEAGNNEHFWFSDEDDNQSSVHPPQGHTGGKWKPGEGPKRCLPIAGKWKPGHGPGPACRKNILKRQVKSRGSKSDVGKTFHCNVCVAYFGDRNSYSLHFSQSQHKELAKVKKQEIPTTDNLDETDTCQKPVSSQQIEVNVSSVEASHKKQNRGCYCPVCDLYFDSAVVLSTHCETKLHKDATLKRSFIEYKNKDDSVIKRNEPAEIIHKENQENIWSSSDHSKLSKAIEIIKVKEPEDHSCQVCQKHFTRKYEMARHLMTRMHRARALKFPEAESVSMLNKYNKYMIRLSPYQCGVCQFYFNRQRDFLDHMGSSSHVITCEDMLGAIMCVACKFKTHKHSEMMEHLQYQEHFAAVEKKHGVCIVRESHTRILCKFCGVRMHSAVRMKRHCQKRHKDRLSEVQVTMDVKPVEFNVYNCPLCQKIFRAKSLLQLHFLKVHKNTSLFNCYECNRGFLDQRRLDNHLRTRFHAKRFAANILSKTQNNNAVITQQKTHILCGLKKRGRGRPRKDENLNFSTVKQKPNIPVPETNTKLTPVETPRRSTRKRKKIEFFHDDEEEELEEKKTKEISKSKQLNKDKTCSVDKINKSPEKVHDKTRQPDNFTKVNKKSTLKTGCKDKSDNVGEINAKTCSSNENVLSLDMNERSNCNKDEGNSRHERVNGLAVSVANDVRTTDAKNESTFDEEDEEDDDDDYSESEDENGERTDVELDEDKINEAGKHIFSCTYCEFAATDLTELRGHYNDNHPNDILTCQPCNQYFLSLKAYKIHCAGRGHQLKLREQSGETKMHKCKMCDKRFLQECCCLLHMETVHRHPSCEADLQRIHKGQDLVTQLYGDHVKQVDSLCNDTSVSCPECGKFVRKDTLVEHLRLHTGERPYICRFCSKGFAGRLTLRRHISSHLNMPMFMCDLCGKEFKRNSHLIKHIRQHDFEKKGEKHTCHVCKVWFFTPEELTRHMKRHGDRNYKCSWPGCHWTFVLSGELKSHMFTHTGEKKYLCDMCGFGAPTKTRLRRHVKTHDKARNFTCDYCPYKATCKTHLKRHMRIHINARPFACPYCNYTCNTHENIRKHILKTQKHKGMKLYPCKLCNGFGCDSSKEFRAHLMTVHANYLRENAIDSLAVFSGLYKREEDFQKPQEGSEIIQVTKGRFFRSYQNPNALIEPPKPKKVKKANKMEEVKVTIVPPSELKPEEGNNHQQEPYHKHDLQQQTSSLHVTASQQPIYLHHDMQHQQGQEENESLVDAAVKTPQYIEVPNMVIHSYDPQHVQQLAGTTVSFASTVMQHPHFQQQPQPVAVTVSDKLYWTVIPEQQRSETAPVPTSTPEPWYSGMPQVHAPTSQELQQYSRPLEVTTSHTGQFLTGPYFCSNIPVADIQNIPNTVTGQIYTGVVENVVVLSD